MDIKKQWKGSEVFGSLKFIVQRMPQLKGDI